MANEDDHNKPLWGVAGLYALEGFADARFEFIINDPHKKMIILALYLAVLSFIIIDKIIMNKKRRLSDNAKIEKLHDIFKAYEHEPYDKS